MFLFFLTALSFDPVKHVENETYSLSGSILKTKSTLTNILLFNRNELWNVIFQKNITVQFLLN